MKGIEQAQFSEHGGTPFLGVLNKLPLLKHNANGCLFMTELEYLFSRQPNGFLAFYKPQPRNPDYKKGNSWMERLVMSSGDIKLEFDKFGVRYDSYSEFEREKDKFKGKYYCSIYDPNRKQAFYLRNNILVNKLLMPIFGDAKMFEIYDKCSGWMLDLKQILNDIEQGKWEGCYEQLEATTEFN